MDTKIFGDYRELSASIAQEITELLERKPDALLCLAAGHTSLGVFEQLLRVHENGRVDFSKARFVGLDEWIGFGIHDEGSCYGFMNRHLFAKIPVPKENIIFFDGLAPDPEAECKRIEDYLEENGPVDFMLLGIGMNGHLGLNEPGMDFEIRSHVVELDQVTRTVGQKYFKKETNIEKGITLGIANIVESKRIVLAISGPAKKEIASKLMAYPVGNEMPATVLKTLDHATVMMDQDAAGRERGEQG